MIYLLDANTLINANNFYYPIDVVPEYWDWLLYQGQTGNVKVPIEIWEEMAEGRKEKDLLADWLSSSEVKEALLFDGDADVRAVQTVIYEGYAADLTDDELEVIGRDPFLISYAFKNTEFCIVTAEVSKPSKLRQNRKVPDVCKTLNISCIGPFEFNRALTFTTNWNRR